MGWIKNRIEAEYRKHKKLDWSKLAESKIISTIKDIIKKKSWGYNDKKDCCLNIEHKTICATELMEDISS